MKALYFFVLALFISINCIIKPENEVEKTSLIDEDGFIKIPKVFEPDVKLYLQLIADACIELNRLRVQEVEYTEDSISLGGIGMHPQRKRVQRRLWDMLERFEREWGFIDDGKALEKVLNDAGYFAKADKWRYYASLKTCQELAIECVLNIKLPEKVEDLDEEYMKKAQQLFEEYVLLRQNELRGVVSENIQERLDDIREKFHNLEFGPFNRLKFGFFFGSGSAYLREVARLNGVAHYGKIRKAIHFLIDAGLLTAARYPGVDNRYLHQLQLD